MGVSSTDGLPINIDVDSVAIPGTRLRMLFKRLRHDMECTGQENIIRTQPIPQCSGGAGKTFVDSL